MKINETLKKLRSAKNLSQSDIAKILEVSLSSYQKYEREKNSVTPSLEVLKRISNYYQVSIDYLLGKEPQEDLLNLLAAEHNMTELEKDIIRGFLNLPASARKELSKYLRSLVETAEKDVLNNTDNP